MKLPHRNKRSEDNIGKEQLREDVLKADIVAELKKSGLFEPKHDDFGNIGRKKQQRKASATVQFHNSERLETEYASATHIGTRDYQQDSMQAGQGKSGVLYGVLCDGMGGLADGELASRTAVDSVAEDISKMDVECDIPEFLTSAIYRANELVYNLQSLTGSAVASGTTIVAAIMADNKLHWISVGDSRIYIIRDSEIACVTRDHAYSLELNELVRLGKLSKEEADADPHRNALLSFLGMEKPEIVDCNRNPFMLNPGDLVLLCSDGLCRSLEDSDILEIVERHKEDLEECARVLPVYALDRAQGVQDNTSVILLRYLRE